eukprot:TRINITY_DN799_c0_g2_i10.p2 TRINITY_DN799_c0_g2~~TRINITY_DN799_c0_g2_i10.p2  ORF type:complete len:118 (+),score=42.95 TRINITY_DN799_c0_g2_i10:69-422(+)
MCIRDRVSTQSTWGQIKIIKGQSQNKMADPKALLSNEAELRKYAKQAFDVMDADGSGSVSRAELQMMMTNVAKTANIAPPSSSDIDKAMEVLDANGDGSVDFEEFIVLVREVLKSVA